MKFNVKNRESLILSDLVAGDVFMFTNDDDNDIYMMTDNDYIDHREVSDDYLVVIGLDNGHLYSYYRNKQVHKVRVSEVNVEL